MKNRGSRGVGLVEYALLIVGVMVLAAAAYRSLGRSASRAAKDASACLGGDCGAGGESAPVAAGYGSTVGGASGGAGAASGGAGAASGGAGGAGAGAGAGGGGGANVAGGTDNGGAGTGAGAGAASNAGAAAGGGGAAASNGSALGGGGAAASNGSALGGGGAVAGGANNGGGGAGAAGASNGGTASGSAVASVGGAGASSGEGAVGSTSSAVTAAAETDAQALKRITDKQGRGERLTQAEIDTLTRIGKTESTGLITASVGVAASVRQGNGAVVKSSAELNSDKGAVLATKAGVVKAVGTAKIEGSAEATTSGGKKVAGSVEVPVFKRGPATVNVGGEQKTNGGANVFVKASVGATTKLSGGGEAKVEVYGKLAVNKLTPAEEQALHARMSTNAARMANAHADGQRLLEINRDRVYNKGLPPLQSLPQ